MSGFRLPAGGAVDRGRPLAFTFDGKPYLGFEGDSIASALLANGVRVVGRSFRSHRPRENLGRVDRGPERDRRRDAVGPHDAEPSRDRRAARQRSRRAIGQRLADCERGSRRASRHALAPSCRRLLLQDISLAALGDVRAAGPRHGRPRLVDPDNRPPADNPQFNARCDMLVVGAGPAGLAAANAAARSGRVVFLLDDRADIGGQLVHRGGAIEGGDWRQWAGSVRAKVEANGGRVMTSTTAFGVYDHVSFAPGSAGRLFRTRCGASRPEAIVVAAGAVERPLVVPDNDRPGGDVGRRGARLSAPLCRSRRQARRDRDQQRQRLSGRRGAERGRRGG